MILELLTFKRSMGLTLNYCQNKLFNCRKVIVIVCSYVMTIQSNNIVQICAIMN